MLNVLSVAIGQCSLLNERAVDWDQRPVPAPALAATMNLSRRNFLVADALDGSLLELGREDTDSRLGHGLLLPSLSLNYRLAPCLTPGVQSIMVSP
jgi:hypothetical protein